MDAISKFSKFRVNISSIKTDASNTVYMLIEQKGFLSGIRRIFEEELTNNGFKDYELLVKWNHFYVECNYLNKIHSEPLNNQISPNFVKVNSIKICCVTDKKIINSIKFKNI